jgi:hypothetical protein
MARRAQPLPSSLGTEFSLAQARLHGVGESRLLGADLERPFRGARMLVLPPRDRGRDQDESPVAREARELRAQIMRRARAWSAVAHDGWFLSHMAAAVLWGLPVPLRLLRLVIAGDPSAGVPPRGLDVAVLGSRRAPRGGGMRGHQLSPELMSIRERDGCSLASPASVWAQLAPLLQVDELVELGDAIVRIPRRRGMERGSPSDALATIEQLRDAAFAGRREGVARLRAALPSVRVGSASPGETRVRLAAVRAGLPEPELDIDVFALDGSAIGYTELGYRAHRLLFEYEGDHHRVDRRQWNRDIDKHAACEAAGWSVTRLTSAHVYPDPATAVARMRAALVRAGWRA